MAQKRVLLIIGGGIAAYKALDLIRELSRRGIACRCILTAAAKQFVTPLSVAALSGEKVYDDLFSLTDETEMGHIELSRSADLVVVAPATADLMAKAAAGLAGDMPTTALLATDKPVMMAPAMNVRMWDHPATQRNLTTLQSDGVTMIGPDIGAMACGEFGAGRMAEPLTIAAAIEDWYAAKTPARRPDQQRDQDVDLDLSGRHVVITAGPTREPLDPVRHMTNHSSGAQGYAIAERLAAAGAAVTLVSGPTALPDPDGVTTVRIETARDMLAACEAALPADAFIGVAAVADWRPKSPSRTKLKLKGDGAAAPVLELVENPDILKTMGHKRKLRPTLVIGFAAETHDVLANARAKRKRKGADWIVANDVSGDVMGGEHNAVTIITAQSEEHWPRTHKTQIAQRLVARIAQTFASVAPQKSAKSPKRAPAKSPASSNAPAE